MQPVAGDSSDYSDRRGLPIRPAVRVTDSLEDPVAGYTVTFVVTGGRGTLLDPLHVTGSDGVARVGGWTLGVARIEPIGGACRSGERKAGVFQATALSRAGVHHFVFVGQPDGVQVNEKQSWRSLWWTPTATWFPCPVSSYLPTGSE